MKALVNCLLLSLSVLACSRQPVGVAVSPTAPAPVPPANEVPLPDPEVQRALEERAEEETVTTTPAPVGIPPTDVLPEEVTVYDNQTAVIENQANVGQAPLGGEGIFTPPTDYDGPEMVYELAAEDCVGDCDSYTFNLASGGMSSLLVDKGKIARGLYERQLYSVDYASLNNSLDSLRGLDLAPVYPTDGDFPAGTPYRSITLLDENGQPRTVKVYSDAPPALQRFLDRLELLIGEQDWQQQ